MIPGTILAEFEFHSKFHQNEWINLAGPSAKFDSSGIPGIAQIPLDSSRNQWKTAKTSLLVSPGHLEVQAIHKVASPIEDEDRNSFANRLAENPNTASAGTLPGDSQHPVNPL